MSGSDMVKKIMNENSGGNIDENTDEYIYGYTDETHMDKRSRCRGMLLDAYSELGRYPKKSDFTSEQVSMIKSCLGPWPRALEASGILPDKSAERAETKKKKRIEAKRKKTQYKLAKKNNKN